MDATPSEGPSPADLLCKSPPRVLLRCYRRSRARWKAKALQRRGQLKRLQHQVRDIDRSRTRWKAKAKQLHAAQQELEQRLRAVEAERDRLQAQLEEAQAKKARPPVAR